VVSTVAVGQLGREFFQPVPARVGGGGFVHLVGHGLHLTDESLGQLGILVVLDGAVLAQMSYPTMELPISLALTYPDRLDTSLRPMDFRTAFSIDFQPMERADYPCFDLALKCGEMGGIMPCVLNASDEAAVNAFLSGKISFTDIFKVVERVCSGFAPERVDSFLKLKETDETARRKAEEVIQGLNRFA